MNRFTKLIFLIAVCLSVQAVAQEHVLSMAEEPHYAQVFSNEYCRAYLVSVGRLEQTQPVVHEHDWVRMTLAGTVERAWNSTEFGSTPYEDPEGYVVSFLFPAARVALRNPRNEPYRALIVEIMQGDDSRNRFNDRSLDPFAQTLGPGVDTHASYATTLTKTSVEIMNVQLLVGSSRDAGKSEKGALLVAMTDLNLSLKQKNADPRELHLSKGDVQWLSAGTYAFTNIGSQPARFVVLDMK